MERKLTRSFALSVLQIIHTRLLVHNCMHRINLNWLYFHPVKILLDRKSTRLNSSHSQISYAVFCLKKKKENNFDYDDMAVMILSAIFNYVKRRSKHHHVPLASDEGISRDLRRKFFFLQNPRSVGD